MPRNVNITVILYISILCHNSCFKVREGRTPGKVVDVENSDASISEVMLIVQVSA